MVPAHYQTKLTQVQISLKPKVGRWGGGGGCSPTFQLLFLSSNSLGPVGGGCGWQLLTQVAMLDLQYTDQP